MLLAATRAVLIFAKRGHVMVTVLVPWVFVCARVVIVAYRAIFRHQIPVLVIHVMDMEHVRVGYVRAPVDTLVQIARNSLHPLCAALQGPVLALALLDKVASIISVTVALMVEGPAFLRLAAPAQPFSRAQIRVMVLVAVVMVLVQWESVHALGVTLGPSAKMLLYLLLVAMVRRTIVVVDPHLEMDNIIVVRVAVVLYSIMSLAFALALSLAHSMLAILLHVFTQGCVLQEDQLSHVHVLKVIQAQLAPSYLLLLEALNHRLVFPLVILSLLENGQLRNVCRNVAVWEVLELMQH